MEIENYKSRKFLLRSLSGNWVFCAITENKEESTVTSAVTIVTGVTTISPVDAPLMLLSRAKFLLHSANPLIHQKSRNGIENGVLANRLYLIGGWL